MLLGAGDAMVFTSLLRLVAVWFRVKQAPFVTQLTGMVGQLGAVAAATPLAAALATWGWTRSFATAASIGVVLAVALLVVVKDSPYSGEAVERIKIRALARTLAEVWGNPGTRLGMWVHFSSQFGATVFTMLWGYPFLVSGEGLEPKVAANLLIVMTVTAMAAGPAVAAFTSRVPFRRSQLVIGIVVAIMIVWAVVLLLPGPAPLWLLVVLVVVRVRPRPNLPPLRAAGAGHGGRQHRWLHGIPADHRPDRHHLGPAGPGGAAGLHPGRLPDRDVGAVRLLGAGAHPARALSPQEPATHRRGPRAGPDRAAGGRDPAAEDLPGPRGLTETLVPRELPPAPRVAHVVDAQRSVPSERPGRV